MFSLSLLFNIGKIFCSFERLREKSNWAKDLFIKFESIGAKAMTFVLRMLVRMLSHPTSLLFYTFLMIFVIDFRMDV